MSIQVLGIGSIFVDTVLNVDDAFLVENKLQKGGVTPIDGEECEALIHSIQDPGVHAPGGSCANVLRGLAQLGWSCYLTGKIGKDSWGDYLLNDLKSNGIHSLHECVSLPTGRILCLVTDNERTMLYQLGASAGVKGSDLKPDYFTGKKLVHIEGYALDYEDLVETAAKEGKAAKALISFDLANFFFVKKHADRIKNLLATSIDIVFGNQDEAQELTGLAPRDAAKAISNLCPLAVVMTGKDGCWVCKKGGEPQQFQAKKVTNVVDPTGAGDLFTAGFLFRYINGQTLDKCAELGAELASRVIQVKGASIKIEPEVRI